MLGVERRDPWRGVCRGEDVTVRVGRGEWPQGDAPLFPGLTKAAPLSTSATLAMFSPFPGERKGTEEEAEGEEEEEGGRRTGLVCVPAEAIEATDETERCCRLPAPVVGWSCVWVAFDGLRLWGVVGVCPEGAWPASCCVMETSCCSRYCCIFCDLMGVTVTPPPCEGLGAIGTGLEGERLVVPPGRRAGDERRGRGWSARPRGGTTVETRALGREGGHDGVGGKEGRGGGRGREEMDRV